MSQMFQMLDQKKRKLKEEEHIVRMQQLGKHRNYLSNWKLRKLTGKQSHMAEGGPKKKKRINQSLKNGHVQIEKMEMHFRENGMRPVIQKQK